MRMPHTIRLVHKFRLLHNTSKNHKIQQMRMPHLSVLPHRLCLPNVKGLPQMVPHLRQYGSAGMPATILMSSAPLTNSKWIITTVYQTILVRYVLCLV